MSKHRNPLKYIERFYLNTYFNLYLPGGNKAYCYRPLTTKVDLGLENPHSTANFTLNEFNQVLGSAELSILTKNKTVFSYLNSYATSLDTNGEF
jgi:hypothetical protein